MSIVLSVPVVTMYRNGITNIATNDPDFERVDWLTNGLEAVEVFGVSGDILLFFPVSWHEYQLGWLHSDDYMVALILLCVAALVYVLQNRSPDTA